MILKIILAALCANLLYTNANLMLAASSELATWQSWMMVVFAITYSLISTLSIFKMQSLFAIVCFAILDGAAVFLHFADHGANFKMIVAVYFGIYTAYTLIVAFAIKRNEDAEDNGNEVEGHDAAYWYKCFLYQKSRAEGDKTPVSEIAEPTPPPQPIVEPTAKAAIGSPRISDEERAQLISVKRAFARMTDPDKRRERIKDLPDDIKQQIMQMYGL